MVLTGKSGNAVVTITPAGAVSVTAAGAINATSASMVTILGAAGVRLGAALTDTFRDLIDNRFYTLFNAHRHGDVQNGGGTTDVPTVLLSSGANTTNTTAS
jgi:small-conductance mechanosensitive channel